jgi:hypothetical protein
MKLSFRQIESGTALVVVMSILATLLVLVGVSFDYTQTINRHVQRSDNLENAISIGDGTIDLMFGYWREACRTQSNLSPTTNNLKAATVLPLPTGGSAGTLFPNVSNFTASRNANSGNTVNLISNYKIVAADPQLVQMQDDDTPPTPGVGQQPTNVTYNYIASVDVTLPTMRGNITTQIRRVFQKEQVSPWAFAIFYVDPLEIHPGPLFKIDGPVATNSDLYTAHNTLQFFDKVTYGGKWYNAYMPGDCRTDPPTPPLFLLSPPDVAPAKQPFGLDASRIFNSGDPNPNNDSYHELIDIPVINPATGVRWTDPLQNQRYYDQAAIKILIDGSGNLTVMKLDGTVVTASSASNNDKKLYNAITAAGVITKNELISDEREVPGGKVRLTTLHVDQLLLKVNDTTNGIPAGRWNGVVYITDTSYTPSTRRGIRLKGGSVLPNGGLTVASANPVYIQGDYNTGSGTIPSNNGDPLNPTVVGYDKSTRPASVIADAVNILSNSWVDSNANYSTASNTTVNTAIVSGIVPTANCHYSGGAENFPRFIENWDTKTFTYYGSMVELYNSKQAVGTWDTAVYSPPLRQWYFDRDFNTHTPPGTLMLYNYIKSRWFMP